MRITVPISNKIKPQRVPSSLPSHRLHRARSVSRSVSTLIRSSLAQHSRTHANYCPYTMTVLRISNKIKNSKGFRSVRSHIPRVFKLGSTFKNSCELSYCALSQYLCIYQTNSKLEKFYHLSCIRSFKLDSTFQTPRTILSYLLYPRPSYINIKRIQNSRQFPSIILTYLR